MDASINPCSYSYLHKPINNVNKVHWQDGHHVVVFMPPGMASHFASN